VGFDRVGHALLRQLISKETELRRKYDVRWRLTGIVSRRIGWIAEPG
jgi:homoserine dehydrogenase